MHLLLCFTFLVIIQLSTAYVFYQLPKSLKLLRSPRKNSGIGLSFFRRLGVTYIYTETALNYASIKVEKEPEDTDEDVVERYFTLLAESDCLDIALSKKRMETKNDRKKRKRLNRILKELKARDKNDIGGNDDYPEYGDAKLPEYQEIK